MPRTREDWFATPINAVEIASRSREPCCRIWPSAAGSEGRSSSSMYTSGGWICPDGKLPDASRPPVGRTRGGQSHP
ncbi:MAG: hypothetical protein ACQESR_10800 [Planctomycetota bacterium]